MTDRMKFSHTLQFVTYLTSWLLLSASGLWFFLTLRNTLFSVSVLFQLNPWAVRGIDQWGVFIFGLLWMVVIFTLEGYLRTSIAKNKFWPRVRKVFLITAVAALALLLLQWLVGVMA